MGFSVSGSAAIVFIGLIVAAGIAIPSVVGGFGSMASAQGQQTDRGVETLNTDIAIETATYNASGNDDLEIRSTGRPCWLTAISLSAQTSRPMSKEMALLICGSRAKHSMSPSEIRVKNPRG